MPMTSPPPRSALHTQTFSWSSRPQRTMRILRGSRRVRDPVISVSGACQAGIAARGALAPAAIRAGHAVIAGWSPSGSPPGAARATRSRSTTAAERRSPRVAQHPCPALGSAQDCRGLGHAPPTDDAQGNDLGPVSCQFAEESDGRDDGGIACQRDADVGIVPPSRPTVVRRRGRRRARSMARRRAIVKNQARELSFATPEGVETADDR
jgi:hypothetical protein